jgi:hypothetical protein
LTNEGYSWGIVGIKPNHKGDIVGCTWMGNKQMHMGLQETGEYEYTVVQRGKMRR